MHIPDSYSIYNRSNGWQFSLLKGSGGYNRIIGLHMHHFEPGSTCIDPETNDHFYNFCCWTCVYMWFPANASPDLSLHGWFLSKDAMVGHQYIGKNINLKAFGHFPDRCQEQLTIGITQKKFFARHYRGTSNDTMLPYIRFSMPCPCMLGYK